MISSKDPADTLLLYTIAEDGSTVALAGRKRHHYSERFLTMFVEMMMLLSKLDRPPVYYRALFWLLTKLDPQQERVVSASQMAEGAEMSQASAERALAMLEADKVILATGPRCARRRRINNRVAWTSRASAHNYAPKDPEVADARGR